MSNRDSHPAALVIEATWTRRDLEAVLKVSGRTIDRLVALGKFPAPLHVGRSCRWRASDIQGYLEAASGGQALIGQCCGC